MLVITERAGQKLIELANKEVLKSDICDTVSGVRIILSGPNNGTQGNRCMIGIDQVRKGDKIEDISGVSLFVDPSSLAYLHCISAILDFRQLGSEENLVLIVEGIGNGSI